MVRSRFSSEPARWQPLTNDELREANDWYHGVCTGTERGPAPPSELRTNSVPEFLRALSTEIRIAALERENELLRADAEKVASTILESIVGITTELFGEAVVYQDADPEFADDKFTVFAVEIAGSFDEILAKEKAWNDRVKKIAPRWNPFRLSLRAI